MANKHRGYVDIVLDKPRKLRFTTNAIAELEDVLGQPITKLDEESLGVKTLRALLWAGLLHENRDLTIEEAGDLMDHANLEDIATKVMEALQLAFGGNTKEKNKVSGPSGAGKS